MTIRVIKVGYDISINFQYCRVLYEGMNNFSLLLMSFHTKKPHLVGAECWIVPYPSPDLEKISRNSNQLILFWAEHHLERLCCGVRKIWPQLCAALEPETCPLVTSS